MKSIQNLPVSGSGIGSDQAIFRILNQTLTFTNLVATVSDARITADDAVLTYYADASAAEAAGIVATWTTGTVTFTAATVPASTVIVSIYVIKPALANVWDNISASEVSYGTSTVAAALDNKVNKSGDTMTGTLRIEGVQYGLKIDAQNGTTSLDPGYSVLSLGNTTPVGTDKNSTGILDLYSDSGNKVRLYTVENVSGTKYVKLPDASGTVALENLTDLTITINTNLLYSNNTKVYGIRFGNIAIITGYLQVKGSVVMNDELFTFSGITPSQVMYASALKSMTDNAILIRIDKNSQKAVVDQTPSTATSSNEFYCFTMAIFGS